MPNVERSQIVVAGGGDGEYEPDSKGLDDGREDTIEVHTMLLSVAVGDKACLRGGWGVPKPRGVPPSHEAEQSRKQGAR